MPKVEPNIETTLEEMKESYNWKEVFKFAPGPTPVLGFDGSRADFGIDDVKKVIASVDGENDGDAWACVVRLKDGRYAAVEASCDYSGWG